MRIHGIAFDVYRIHLDRQGYMRDKPHRYYGVGAPLYGYSSDEPGKYGQYSGEIRAADRDDAKQKIADIIGKDLGIGRRVEIHPGCDLWMRGAKFGGVERIQVRDGARLYVVRMDHPGVKRLQRFPADRIFRWL